MKLKSNDQFLEEIKNTAARKRISLIDLSAEIGMKQSTFYRNMSGKGLFSLHHSILLANALDLELHLEA